MTFRLVVNTACSEWLPRRLPQCEAGQNSARSGVLTLGISKVESITPLGGHRRISLNAALYHPLRTRTMEHLFLMYDTESMMIWWAVNLSDYLMDIQQLMVPEIRIIGTGSIHNTLIWAVIINKSKLGLPGRICVFNYEMGLCCWWNIIRQCL